jgi:hypothetical protein
MNDLTFWDWVDTDHDDFVDFAIEMYNSCNMPYERLADENDSTEPNSPETILN